MQLAVIFAAILAAASGELAPQTPVDRPALRLALLAYSTGIVCVFAMVASLWIAITLDRAALAAPLGNRLDRLRRTHVILWLTHVIAAYSAVGWPQLVRFNFCLDAALVADEVVLFLPLVAPLVVGWLAMYQVERAAARARGPAARCLPAAGYLMVHVRFYLAPVLVPMFLLFAFRDVVQTAVPGVLESESGWLILVAPLVVLALAMPWLIRLIWPLEPLAAGPLRTRLKKLSAQSGLRAPRILVWHTGHMVTNAAVAGFWPPMRYVLLSDRLLEQLTPGEIEAVFAHELGHVYHRHALQRLGLLAAVAITSGLLWRAGGLGAGDVRPMALWPFLMALPGLLGMLALAALALRRLVAAWEHQADLYACRLLACQSVSPEQSISRLARALGKLTAAADPTRGRPFGWHPSTPARVARLQTLLPRS